MDRLRLRFWRSALGVGAVEMAGIALPLLFLVGWPERPLPPYIGWVVVLAVVHATIWHTVMSRWLGAIYRARARQRAGLAVDIAALQSAMLALPFRAFWLRSALWTAFGAALAALAARAGFSIKDVAAHFAVLAANGAAISLCRASWYEWLLERPLRDLFPAVDPEPLQLFGARYRARLLRMALLTTVFGLSFFALFLNFFLPITLEQYRFLQTAVPATALLVGLLWYPFWRWQIRSVAVYFEAADPEAVAAAAYANVQRLAYRLATAKAAAFLTTLLFALWLGVRRDEIDAERAILCSATALVVGFGVALLEGLLLRSVLRPFLEHLRRRHATVLREGRTAWTLARRMALNFGGLTLLVCCFSLFWAYVQYWSLDRKFLQAQADRELVHLLHDIRAQVHDSPPSPELVGAKLREQFSRDRVSGAQVAIYYVPPRGAATGVTSTGPPPALPRALLSSIRRRGQGWLDVSDLRMLGAFRMLGRGPEWGQLVLLLPDQRGRVPGIEPQLSALLFFFLVLFAAAIGMVAFAVRDLTKPVRALEGRAEAMAAGDMTTSVPLGADADELGQLAVTFEEMRRAVNRTIAALQELQVGLEQRVKERTLDLQRSNEELLKALDALRLAQNKLVAQGKMAIVGQLLAGIAHEINNPVNAIVNTVGPLEDAALSLAGAAGPDAAVTKFQAELAEMIAVIRRGAERTKNIVQALRNYARGDGEELSDVDLHRNLDGTLELLRHELKDGVVVERRYGEVGQLRGYAGQLNQVFLNLLTNAVHAVAGRGDGRIVVATRRKGRDIELTVSDNGHGIAPEVLPRIFEPFFTTKPVGEGTGLGLSICQQIAERHGGSIRVESVLGGGTSFTVTLPQE